MFVRINWGKVRSGTWDDYEAAYKEVMGRLDKPSGLEGRWLARDADDEDAGFAISLWADRDSLDAYANSSDMKNEILPALEPYFSGEFKATVCEVRHAEGTQ